MIDQLPQQSQESHVTKAIEITIRIGVLIFLVSWCFQILSPFFSPIIWGLIIAVTEYPVYHKLKTKLKGRKKLPAFLITLTLLVLLALPSWLLADSLIEAIQHLKGVYENEHLLIPDPDELTKTWPSFTQPLIDIWKLASENISAALAKFAPEIKTAGAWLLSALAGTGVGILQFILSIIIAGVFLVYSESGGDAIRRIFTKLAGLKGHDLANLSEITIRNVVKGILGVAFIQAFLAGIGFFIAGVPLAGLWTLFCLIFAIIQIGISPVAIVVVIYMYSTADTLTATLLMIWLILVTLADNFLKPILLGRGAPVPMLVVFLGSLGGFVANGFIGLFLGAVILSLGYTLFLQWIEDEVQAEEGKVDQANSVDTGQD